MIARFARKLDFEWFSFWIVIFLLSFGTIAIYSLSINSEGFNNFHRQLLFFPISLFFFLFFALIDYRSLKSYSAFFYLAGLVLLILVFWFGKNIRGTSSWFDLGFFNFQPAELVKIFIIITLAKFFSKNANKILSAKDIALSFVYVFIPVLLIAKQPDFGSAIVILIIWIGMLFLTNIKKKFILVFLVLMVFASVISWNFILKNYQKQRIEVILNPQADPLGSGYNALQSVAAIGSGGIKGKGLGRGSQSQLNFLPEKHNDFIFAAISEESGFIGSGIIIIAFGFLFYRFSIILKKSNDFFGQMIIGGIMIMFFFQVVINIGMNLGVVPVVGLSLPFFSYGGSFLVAIMISFGLAQSIWRKRRKNLVLNDDFFS